MEVYYQYKNNITQLPIDEETHEVEINGSIAKITPGEKYCHVIYKFGDVNMNLRMDEKHPAYSFTCNEGIVTFQY
jgi:hypothetical protein